MKLGAIHRARPGSVARLAARSDLDGLRAPAETDYFKKCPADGDPLGNDLIGNCVPCSVLREIQVRRTNAFGDEWKPTAPLTIPLYTKWSGFDPATGKPDEGCDTVLAMTSWATDGVWVNEQDLDIVTWVSVDHANLTHTKLAIFMTGAVGVTLAMPQAAQDLSAWATAPGTGPDWAPASWGYHRVMSAKYSSDTFTVRTWGNDLVCHPEFWSRYVVAVDATLSVRWFDTTGLAPPGLDWAALKADMAQLA